MGLSPHESLSRKACTNKSHSVDTQHDDHHRTQRPLRQRKEPLTDSLTDSHDSITDKCSPYPATCSHVIPASAAFTRWNSPTTDSGISTMGPTPSMSRLFRRRHSPGAGNFTTTLKHPRSQPAKWVLRWMCHGWDVGHCNVLIGLDHVQVSIIDWYISRLASFPS